ncbi:MAG TPA: ATP-binding protein [Candidatus Babeliales bacterium]|jgi:hypothetical protein|nr:ATP-binding protein [Candidatus Babeliales bacterium]
MVILQALGTIISGSLADGLVMRVASGTALESIKTGKFVSIVGSQYRFFSLITDMSLATTNQDILLFPPQEDEPLLRDIIQQRDVYATVVLRPMLMLGTDQRPCPVKTIPAHFSLVYEASAHDVALIFGDEQSSDKNYFNIGCPLDMQTPVCINLEKVTERSNGIFGKTGTGKTFLTRLVLAGLIKQCKAVNLIFDMHSEYGLQARTEGKSRSFVKGLKTLFPDRIIIVSLDPASTRRRGGSPDIEFTLDYQSIEVEDILSLQYELNLHPTAMEAAYLIFAHYKQDWLQVLLSKGEQIKEFAESLGAHPESVAALYRKLQRLARLPFLYTGMANDTAPRHTVIDQIMAYLNKGISIVIEFGNFTASFVYLLIANIITRRIHREYINKTEQFLGSHYTSQEPQKLMITIEEAHKFLNSNAAKQTIFGTIAREMRKYYVSLLVVDQRPSGIDAEVLSQIGTKIIAQLHDDKDIQAVLTGISGAQHLRTILAGLDSKKQALLLGHALAMPVVVQTREYDETFYTAMQEDMMLSSVDTLVKELF